MSVLMPIFFFFFFFNDTATTEIYTLSLHDALPILPFYTPGQRRGLGIAAAERRYVVRVNAVSNTDRKSTRLNSSHSQISYAVFCLKKKNKQTYFEGNRNSPPDPLAPCLSSLLSIDG